VRDPHYQKILEGLAVLPEWQKFEECVIDLLRDAYPRLVPIHGGHDFGMDGAIADAEGEAYPLVVTTAKDVIGNLTRNLDSYLAGGGLRRRVVVATSTELSPTRRRNLEKRAREKGFVLIQVHERRDIASRLYRNSRWAQELLGLSGDLPALSAIPRRHTALREDLDLVGRDADLRWLRETSQDRLVVGQPGSGKTSLLSRLVREGRALFLASRDEGRIANACRDLLPEIVIVDDAHLDPEMLELLCQIRQAINAQFALVATTWPGAEDEVANSLGGIGTEHRRRLELLTRAEILEVLRSLGIEGPDDDPYLRSLVDQSANKPGLAVTLGSLWLRGEWREVLTGGAIRRTLIPALKRVLEHDPAQLLACFALGGDRGMGLEAVGCALGVGLGEVRSQATRASHGGVLSVRGTDALTVQPEVLRSALIQEVFFTPPALPYRPLLDQAPSKDDAVDTLVRAALRQVPIPEAELRNLVAETDSSEVWRHFAALGEQQAEWVLEHYPGEITAVAREVLDSAPKAAVRRLLREATGAEGPLHSRPSHPLRILQDWVQDIPEGSAPEAESLRRRRWTIEEAKACLATGQGSTAARRALFLALSPRLHSTRDTVTGGGMVMRQGSLPASTVPEMLELWDTAREEIRDLDSETWAEIEDTLHYWIHPNVLGRELPPEDKAQMRSFARRALGDLAPLAEGHPGLAAALVRLADEVDLELELSLDPGFQALFPLEPSAGDLDDRWQAEREAARDLAERWKERSPVELARDLSLIGEEARLWGHPWPGQIPEFCDALVEKVASPEEYLKVFLNRPSDPMLVNYFLRHTVGERRPGWQEMLDRSLRNETYTWTAVDIVLNLQEPADQLLDRALELAEPRVVEGACHRGVVPVRTLERLLAHPKPEIALAAAIGEWLAHPQGKVRVEALPAWRRVVLGVRSDGVKRSASSSHGYWLENILGNDPELAFDWIRAQVDASGDDRPLFVSPHGLFPPAIRALDDEQRVSLLESLSGEGFGGGLLPYLIDKSQTLYRHLLDRSELRRYHLAPLAGKVPDRDWIEMAGLALGAGHDPRRIADVAFRYEGVISGFGVEHWKKWKDAFETWANEAEGPLRDVAVHGAMIAGERIEAARAEKRQFELTGRF
jgi:hypothetical protein